MHNCYCKNCNYVVGELSKYKHVTYIFCKFIKSKNFNTIYFMNCKNCDKFVGIICWRICINCFEKHIFGEENLFNWFKEYKKIILQNLEFKNICKICDKTKYRGQCWFFKELTFYKE